MGEALVAHHLAESEGPRAEGADEVVARKGVGNRVALLDHLASFDDQGDEGENSKKSQDDFVNETQSNDTKYFTKSM